MKRTSACARVVAILFLSSATGGVALAGVDVNRFEAILETNPFRLRPVPPPQPEAPPPAPPAAPLAVVELTGVTSILGSHRALFEITPAPGKPTVRPILKEGERVESVELVSIDITRGEVTIRNGTVLTNLPLKVAKASSPTSPVPMPGTMPGVGPGGAIGQRMEAAFNGRLAEPVSAAGTDANGTPTRGVNLGGGAVDPGARPIPRRLSRPAMPPLPGAPTIGAP